MNGFEKINIPWEDWKIVRELGEDSCGKDYEIERTQHGITERDALKIIRIPKNRREYEAMLSLTSEDEESTRSVLSEKKDRLINEIRAVQRLDATDNIVGIKDWSVSKLDDGYSWEIYIRMDLLTPLVQYAKKNKGLEEEEVIKLGEDICRALVECEKEKIVHRDIKPDNIMVSKSGKFKLGNFGIARYFEDDTATTIVGTKAYMAPEIYNHRKAGKTVDIYSLGLVLYVMLNNCRPPFIKAKGKYNALEKEGAIQRRLRGEELPEPANGSDALKKIVLKACDPAPSKRYRTAATMLKALEGLTGKEPKKRKGAPKPGRQSITNVNIPWPGWKIVKELGEGGYGKVYEIERTQYGITENDALKIIRIPKDRAQYDAVAYSLASEGEESIKEVFSDQKDKLINEVREIKKLKVTDNIVDIKDWSVSKLDDGYSWEIYIRMDLLTPLVQYVKKNKGLEEEEAIKLGEDICRALVECEKEKIVHRDIKPDNIMVSDSGIFKLGDFGIARYLEDDTTMTAGAGTRAYMAPEINNIEKAGKTVDIYSLGLVLYEMLNNCRPPFLSANGKISGFERPKAIQRRLRGEELPEPANGSDALKKIVLKACEPDPSKRYRTAAAMLNAFEKLKIRGYREKKEANKSAVGENTQKEEPAAPLKEEPLNVNPDVSFDWSAVADEPHMKEKKLYAEMTPKTDRSRTMSFIDLLKAEKDVSFDWSAVADEPHKSMSFIDLLKAEKEERDRKDDSGTRESAGIASFCSNCGNRLGPAAKFCGVCGNRVQGAAAQEFRFGDDTVFKEQASDKPEDLYFNVTPRLGFEKKPEPEHVKNTVLEEPVFEEPDFEEPKYEEPVFDEDGFEEDFNKYLDLNTAREENPVDEAALFAEMEKATTIKAPDDNEDEVEALRKRLMDLTGMDIKHDETAEEPVIVRPESRTLKFEMPSFIEKVPAAEPPAPAPATTEAKSSDVLSLEELEKELFGETHTAEAEAEETKKIDKFYTLYRKNEEFQRLLADENDNLKGENPAADAKTEAPKAEGKDGAVKMETVGEVPAEQSKAYRQVEDETIYKAFEMPSEHVKAPPREVDTGAEDGKEVPAEQNNGAEDVKKKSYPAVIITIVAVVALIVIFVGRGMISDFSEYSKVAESTRSSLAGEWKYSYSEGSDDTKYKDDDMSDSYILLTEDGDIVVYIDNRTYLGKWGVQGSWSLKKGADTDYSIDIALVDIQNSELSDEDEMNEIFEYLTFQHKSSGDAIECALWDGDTYISHFYEKKGESVPEKPDETNSDQNNTDGVTETLTGPPDSLYTAGKEYILKDEMSVREEPSTDSAVRKASELAEEDRDKAVEGEDAVIAKGSTVKCLEASGNWIRIPSGWICGNEKGRYHIVDAELADISEESRNHFCNKIGVDPETSPKLTGIYTTDDENRKSVEFFEDGECAVLYSSPAVPVTDEEGYTKGVYAVEGDIVYLNCGGSVYAQVYEISGDTLIKLPEKIDLMP